MCHRQRLLSQELSLFNLANRHLPRELQQMLRCAVPAARPNAPAGHAMYSTHTHTRTTYSTTHTTYVPQASGGSKRKRGRQQHGDEEDDEQEEMVYPEDEEEEEEEEEDDEE
ncbi:hypothetical protein M419DRAFT_7448 [Trichoderma reesei RUT C-30]|uniref:Uncharacterized protein n=1 Tax=Hypocrea jecorina (strain ATCC 56765 / BCRC 32924 / NRRL 11460 / Rut C-30) TaxID=1344414 RepID=A0A024SDX8_HYPJR|nr:hypothetical protein M419DRAFT_7448 [Trichoderma reesei RUT C-30]